MKWDSDHGIWSLLDTKPLSIHGTTFRNAGYLNLSIDFYHFSIDLYFGKHIGTNLWFGDYVKMFEWKPKDCNCYGCAINRPMSPEAIAALRKILKDKKQ